MKNPSCVRRNGVDLGMSRKQKERIPKTADYLNPIRRPAHPIFSADQLRHHFKAINAKNTSVQCKCPYFHWIPVTKKRRFAPDPFLTSNKEAYWKRGWLRKTKTNFVLLTIRNVVFCHPIWPLN